MGIAHPEGRTSNPARKLLGDVRAERAARVPFPIGETKFSLARTRRFAADPLTVMLESYERFGPVFTLRLFHGNAVFMIGPEANQYVTVSHAANFSSRAGHMRDLIPLLGDGLLTTDGDYHRRSRRIMLPVFHRERVAGAVDVMVDETEVALSRWRHEASLDLHRWMRELATRIASRALFGFEPDRASGETNPAELFEQALSFYATDYSLQLLRGPGTPFARMKRARIKLDRVIYGEIARRRIDEDRGEDVLSLLLDAQNEDGAVLSDRQIRDEVMTLLFAGHDTTASTLTFLLYEVARHPEVLERILAEQESVLDGHAATAEQLMSGALPELQMAVDETLRMYPPAWSGPRRSISDFEFAGQAVPGGVPVFYSPWATQHLPELFDDPMTFRPERFAPDRKAALPKNAYMPFGGGSRMCIGMRFGLLEISAIATLILSRFTIEIAPEYELSVRQRFNLGPHGGLPVTVRARSGTRTVTRASAQA